MRRGFKAWAERQALERRQALDLCPEAPLPANCLAQLLRVKVITPADIPDMPAPVLRQLLSVDPHSWSAVSIVANTCTMVIRNPTHSPARQESDVMHELAHHICEHRPARMVQFPGFPFPMRHYNSVQEDEAGWLGGCLQLPREALMWALRRRMTDEGIAQHYSASIDMVRYRRSMTGVDRQLKAKRR